MNRISMGKPLDRDPHGSPAEQLMDTVIEQVASHNAAAHARASKRGMAPTTAVIYARAASRAAADAAAIDDQVVECESAAAELGAEVVGVFADSGVSGNVADRPALNAMLGRLADQDIDLLICLDPTRLARSFEVYDAITAYADIVAVEVVFARDLVATASNVGRGPQ